MGAFHAYDIRGIYGKDFDKTTAYKVGYFLPELLKADKVLVGRDCRVSSPEIHDALIEGICDAGADAYDIGLSSTPMVYFGTANYGFKASVQITASHNPAEYNGMKVSRENALPVGLDSGLDQIREWIESSRPTPAAAKRGTVHEMDIHADYINFMKKFKGDYSKLKLAFDLSNGMANLFAKEIYGDAPEYIFDTIDGRFPNHEPNPLVAKNVEPLKELVRRSGADIGIIYDGDADRVMFVDDKARFIAPDLIIALMALYFCDERGARNPRVLQEIRSSKAVGEFLEKYGADLHTWKVGRAFAAPKLREIDGLWGGELAGHYYFKDFFYSDSGLLLHDRPAHRIQTQGARHQAQRPDRLDDQILQLRRDQLQARRQGRSDESRVRPLHGPGETSQGDGFRRIPSRVSGLVVQHPPVQHRTVPALHLRSPHRRYAAEQGR